MFRCLQRVAVAKTLSSVTLANGLGKLLEEAFSQLEPLVGSLHALWFSETLHLVGNARPVLYCSSVTRAQASVIHNYARLTFKKLLSYRTERRSHATVLHAVVVLENLLEYVM
jgi:hypothetical protein